MVFLDFFIPTVLAVWIFMTIFYLISLYLKDSSVADIAWGLGYIMIAILNLFISTQFYQRQVLVTALVLIWGLRLAIHIFIRNKGKKEDWRYAQFRKDWGDSFLIRSYLQNFMLQGLFMLIISTSIVVVMSNSGAELIWLDYVGLALWIIGFLFESVGDYQLMKFKNESKNKGKVIKTGLWKYTRHPNYFGEVTMWWGIWLIALNVPGGFWSIVSPLLITYLILFVSGVPMLEKKYEGKREFEQYKKKTSIFFPLPPRK